MKQAMIFAAGLGTRLRPLTDTMPKALVSVAGHPLLWHVVMKLKAAGYERIVVNVHHFASQITDYLTANSNFGLDIRISDEREALLDTGGGIRKALPLLDAGSPVLIHNVDILSNLDLARIAVGAPGTDALLVVSWRDTKRYLLFDERMALAGWTNIETGEVKGLDSGDVSSGHYRQLAFSGIHLLQPSAYPLLRQMPERFGIIDFYLKYCHREVFAGYEQPGLQLLDVGKPGALLQAEHFVAQTGAL